MVLAIQDSIPIMRKLQVEEDWTLLKKTLPIYVVVGSERTDEEQNIAYLDSEENKESHRIQVLVLDLEVKENRVEGHTKVYQGV